MNLTISVSVKKVIWLLSLALALLMVLNLAGYLYESFLGSVDPERGLVPLFFMKSENSLPTWYSSFMLLCSALLLAVISYAKKSNRDRYVYHWGALSIIFLYLSVDEAATVHERISRLGRMLLKSYGLDPSTILYGLVKHAWVVPYAGLVIIFVLFYFSFFLTLPARQRFLFLAAATFYVGGAMGLEVFKELFREEGFIHNAMSSLEEPFEMVGILVFIYALLDYLRSYVKGIRLHIKE